MEAGLAKFGDMGVQCLDWSELKAWRDMTETETEPNEILAIVAASKAFADGCKEFSGVSENPPYSKPLSDAEQVVADAARDERQNAEMRQFLGIVPVIDEGVEHG